MVGVDFAPTALGTARALAVTRGVEAEYLVGDRVRRMVGSAARPR